jgi:hypothetical protein
MAPTAWDPLTTNQTPLLRQSCPTPARSTTCPENECTQVRQTTRVRRVSAACTSFGVSTSASGSTMRTWTPRSRSDSHGRMSEGKSLAGTTTSSSGPRSSPLATRCSP